MSATDDDVIEAAIKARGEWAQLESAFARTRNALSETLLGSALTENALREKLYLSVQVLDAVAKAMRETIQAGEIEELAERIRVTVNASA